MSGVGDAALSADDLELLSLLLGEAGVTAAEPETIRPREPGARVPLTFAQERLWFLDRLQPDTAVYNIHQALRVRGPLDAAALETALGEVVRRHEALRTVLAEVDGSPVQVVAPFAGFALPVEDLSDRGADAREAEVRRLAGEDAARPFDLETGPLFRARLLRLAEGEHVLLLCMHHVVSDGWSMGVLFRELSALYAAFREGRPSPLAELPVQYADFALWQREQLRGEALERQLGWWRGQLSGAPELLELPTDHPRPAVQSFHGASERVELAGALAERLRALGRREGATLFMVALGAFQVLLSRYTGSEDVVVGSPIAGRTRGETEALIGFFVNTLVLRTELAGDPGFREVVGRVRESTLGAYEHQELPFEKLVAELSPERSLSRSPLVQVMFVLQNTGEAGLHLEGVETEEEPGGGAESAKFDLTLSLREGESGLEAGLGYATELFERQTAGRMLGHLRVLLEQVAAAPDRRIGELELLTGAERRQVLEEWSRTGAEPPAERCIHQLFEEQAQRTPHEAAVVFEGEALSYAELDARANRLAHHLRSLGVRPEVRVGVCVERSLEMVVALLAVLKAGGAYLPLDPAYPAGRLALMLEDAAVPLLLTQARLEARLPPHAARVLRLDADRPSIAAEPGHAPAALATPRNAAYVIYTSGSTGRPKGVVVEHRGVLNLLADFQARAPLRPGDRCSVWTSLGFDVSVYEIFSPLLAGACLHVPTEELRLDAGAYLEWLAGQRIRGAYLPPFFLSEYRRWLEENAGRACMGRLLVGVEPIPESLLAGIGRSVPGLRIVNGYGPTEATICSTLYDVPARAGGARTAPIGRPVAHTRAYVLDGSGRPCPVGVPGELHLGGVQLARGYLGDPEHTAERFVPDGLSGSAGERLYRTGDRVRWLAEGSLEFLGRVDRQVKVRGFRVEPGEIESVLVEEAGVEQAVVVAREEESGRRLVAYVVGAAGLEPARLRERLRARLPEYMVPGAVVVLERLPLTPSGKVDRAALPAPEWGGAGAYAAPRTALEEILCGIWAEVLGVERVGVHDNFFELGGHSLLATRVVARVAAALGVAVPLRALFEAQSVAELAARVDAERSADEGAGLPPFVAVDRSAPLPLSFAQERLWFLHQMEPGGAGYHMPWPVRLRGRLDARALARALGELVRRHESLRTTFRPADRGAVQVVHPRAAARLPTVDLAGLAPEERAREARRLAAEDAARPFDLERGPLLRPALLRLADDEHVLLLCMHHVVSDGWSMGVLFRELFTLCLAFSRGEPSPLPPLRFQYADYAVWQRGWLVGEALRRQLDWWREHLGGSPPALELPTDRPRPAVASGGGRSLGFRVPADVARGLRALARREGATLYMVLHAALDLLLARWSGQEDLVVGSPIAGRGRVELEGLIGFFVNTVALRTDLSGDPPFAELLGRVRETALGAYAHQDLPFERLVEEVAPERTLSHTPLFQVMFALQNARGGEAPELPGLRLEPFPGQVRTARFDLELDLREEGDELAGSLRFRADLFDAATMERFSAQYRTLLASVHASPGDPLSRLEILPPEEARALLAYGSGPAHGSGGFSPVHRLVAAQAARTPDATAVRWEGGALSYARLDAGAARLAGHLRRRGAAPGTTVAVCLERGPWLLVALLAVWKAGCVHLPLDPGYPAERLSFLLRDSEAGVLLTESRLAGSLPEHGAGVVLVDDVPDGAPPGPEVEAAPDDLAYLIYTSGSTGTPKAVMVEHGQLAHTLHGALGVLGLAPDDVVAALASVAFDISLLELVAPLLAGAAVRIVPRPRVLDVEELLAAARDATVLHAVPALMRQVVEAARGGPVLPELRLLLVGGDTVAPDLLEEMREVFPRARTHVLYGPTEGTIICAAYAVPPAGAVAGHPLGHPLPGVRLRVRGPRGETLPVGVPGEVWISGAGVARGYLGRPELTADRFVGDGGGRAYRTGDRARWRPDGVLEFLGRTDEQVKVRGFRIEPAEVEAALRGEPGVREAVVVAREDRPGDRRLVAYVVPEAADRPAGERAGRAQVADWEALFEETYGEDGAAGDPTLDFKGWNSSYTGAPIPREEMREWVDRTVERILALAPERVLEIGCGTGLLLFRVAPHTRAYHATDFSGVALEHVRRHLHGLPWVTLSRQAAHEPAVAAGAGFDTVVVNSVAQYFPGVEYLLRVLEGAAAAVRPGGRIFVGDVRSLPLLGAFHASVALARAPGELPVEQLRARVRREVSEEQELALDPALFQALAARIPRVGRVEVQVKQGVHDNELSRFRYDVVLHLDAGPAAAAGPAVRAWGGEDVAGLRALAASSARGLLVRGVPDARVAEHVRALELLSRPDAPATAEEVRRLAAERTDGIRPEALFALGGELGRAVEVRPGAAGTLDVLVHPAGGAAAFPTGGAAAQPWEAYANDPQWGRRARALVPALRAALQARLPEYMVPSALVALESLPLTPNGKVDRQALPAPDGSGEREEAYVAPRSALETVLAEIWGEVLGVERVGIHDGFFELGGHSLLATQLVSRIRALRVEVPVRQVFQSPTVAGLAESLVRNEAKPGAMEMIAGVLLKLKTMSAGERAAALRARQPGSGS